MSTEFPSKNGIDRQWHVIDAQDVVLGKLASKAAMLLMGKTKPIYTPFLDTGDHVIVINAEQSPAHGPERREQGLPPFHRLSRADWWKRASSGCARPGRRRIVEEAIRGMLPKTKLGKQMYPEIEGLRG